MERVDALSTFHEQGFGATGQREDSDWLLAVLQRDRQRHGVPSYDAVITRPHRRGSTAAWRWTTALGGVCSTGEEPASRIEYEWPLNGARSAVVFESRARCGDLQA